MTMNVSFKPYENIGFSRINPEITSVKFRENNVHAKNKNKEDEFKLKAGVALSTAVGVSVALASISKRQGFSLNPKKIFSQKMKDWAIFKILDPKKPDVKTLNLQEKEILTIGASSVLGGLFGGIIFDDKSQFKSKLQESLNQMLGDIAVPLTFVAIPSRIYEKQQDKIMKVVPQFKNSNNSGVLKFANKFMKSLPPVMITGVFLASGIIAGNKVSNFINEKLYHKKVDRKIKPTDFAPHLDDLCLAITLMASNSPIGSIISKLIPLALMVAGNEVGKAKEE